MRFIRRKARPGGRPHKCQVPGCNRSATVDLTLLGTDFWPVCMEHARECDEAYENARTNWRYEAHKLAEEYRSAA